MEYKIYPLGESAITIDFGNEISIDTNDLVINLAKLIEKENFKGFIECVPAYSTFTIFYDLITVRKNNPNHSTAFEAVNDFIESIIKNVKSSTKSNSTVIEIPVSFNKEFALDLEFVAKHNNLKPNKVIEIFLSRKYQVFMLGFLPGFAYMGELDDKIATPRKRTPKMKVPKGSVGIAGRQTGIYPLESPGGWQIIGRTDVKLFTPNEKKLTLFQAGDLVKFYEV